MPAEPKRILILGGTLEARKLAERLVEQDLHRVITSFAGRTRERNAHPGEVRVGGFGGIEGLRIFVESEPIDLIADASHPFAAQISSNAVAAAAQAGIPCVRLDRPPWEIAAEDDWRPVSSIEEAVAAIPSGAVALVTVGRQEIAPFFARDDVRIVARMIEQPDGTPPAHVELVLARPPFGLEEERTLFADKDIGILVAKNSGGESTAAKLVVARERKLPVIMIERPELPAATGSAASLADFLDLIHETLRRGDIGAS